ncbi:MAG: RNA ligase family protein [Desulfatitalea sp.]|nr:RNA ligase family protein [Desulfatitalea sp.]MBI5896783.1 RNA ligase family protein [Desulfobacterales bacterium]
MNDLFYKFPSTPHLTVLGNNSIRDDKVLTENERREYLRHEIVIEEKVDGANLGISFNVSGDLRIQSRGEYLQPPYSGQWKKISEWLTPKIELLRDGIKDRYLLFGEWCYAQHSIFYSRLPDWFLGFDIFDKQSKKFLSCSRRDERFRKLGILGVPLLNQGRFSFDEVLNFLSVSRLGGRPAEGIYLRMDEKGWICGRAKLVRPEFIQSIEGHWSRKSIKTNRCNNRKKKASVSAD